MLLKGVWVLIMGYLMVPGGSRNARSQWRRAPEKLELGGGPDQVPIIIAGAVASRLRLTFLTKLHTDW